MGCKHEFDWICESREAEYSWCNKCGALKRKPTNGKKVSVYLSSLSTELADLQKLILSKGY